MRQASRPFSRSDWPNEGENESRDKREIVESFGGAQIELENVGQKGSSGVAVRVWCVAGGSYARRPTYFGRHMTTMTQSSVSRTDGKPL